MTSSSSDLFCALDLLADVASATIQNDPSLIPVLSLQKTKNFKVGNSFSRKSANSCEKLTLDQIKGLSEKNLIEMFSEHECDEIKRKYSFQCFLIPEKCSQIYKSFGNETSARYKIKAHLLSHINDLVAASDATDNEEVFMAEPLHARRKRLKEMNQKSSQRKKKNKPYKIKKDSLDISANNAQNWNVWRAHFQNPNAIIQNSNLNLISEEDYSTLNPEINRYVKDNMNNVYASQSTGTFKYSRPYFSSRDSTYKERISKGQSFSNDFNTTSFKGHVKRKRSKRLCKPKMAICSLYEHDSFIKYSFHCTKNNSYFDLDVQSESESEIFLPMHHDHTYTSVNGKTLNSDLLSASESSRSVNIFKDPFQQKKPVHQYLMNESPLIIPTPPFPYVYNPHMPHAAFIREVSSNITGTNDDPIEDFNECNNSPKCAPLLLVNENEVSENTVNQSQSSMESKIDPEDDENTPSDTYVEDVSEDGSNGETNSVSECNNSPKCAPLLLVNENEVSENTVNQSQSSMESKIDPEDDENTPSDTYVEDVSEDGSNGETNSVKFPDSSFCLDDVLRPECPENLRAVEKKLALKCIRALRTKKKEERGPLTCQICKNKSFTAQATLMYHYRSHAGIKPYTCSVCEATFTRQHSLNYHMLIHNNKSRFVCTDCGRNFRHPSHYKEHLRRHTGEIKDSVIFL